MGRAWSAASQHHVITQAAWPYVRTARSGRLPFLLSSSPHMTPSASAHPGCDFARRATSGSSLPPARGTASTSPAPGWWSRPLRRVVGDAWQVATYCQADRHKEKNPPAPDHTAPAAAASKGSEHLRLGSSWLGPGEDRSLAPVSACLVAVSCLCLGYCRCLCSTVRVLPQGPQRI